MGSATGPVPTAMSWYFSAKAVCRGPFPGGTPGGSLTTPAAAAVLAPADFVAVVPAGLAVVATPADLAVVAGLAVAAVAAGLAAVAGFGAVAVLGAVAVTAGLVFVASAGADGVVCALAASVLAANNRIRGVAFIVVSGSSLLLGGSLSGRNGFSLRNAPFALRISRIIRRG